MSVTSEHRASPSSCIDRLTPFPTIVLRLLELTRDEDAEWKDFAELIGTDPVLTAQTLKAANSALHGAKGEIGSLFEAVARFGGNGVVKIVMETCLRQCFSERAAGLGETKAFIWRWCLAIAHAAEKEARGKADTTRAYTLGLLVKLPYVALAQHDPEVLAVLEAAVKKGETLSEAEKAALGADHAALGADALESWGFPAELGVAMRHHHEPDRAGSHAQLAAALCAGEELGSLVMAAHPHREAAEWLLEGARVPGSDDERHEKVHALVERMHLAADAFHA